MIKKRLQMAGIALLILIAFLLLGVFGSFFTVQKQKDEMSQGPVEEPELYRNQGLESGIELSQIPEKVERDVVSFSDRVMLRCNWTETELQDEIQVLKDFFVWTRKQNPNINVYITVMPLRIGFESSFSTDPAYNKLVEREKEKLVGLEEEIFTATSRVAVSVPVIDALAQHEDEYLFYRTEASWTARGAYYAGQEFLKAAGLETFPIDSFWEYARNSYTGFLAQKRGYNLDPDKSDDFLYYYLHESYNPLIDWQTMPDVYEEMPMLTHFISNSHAFLHAGHHGDADYGKFKGKAKNGRSLMIVDSGGGNILASWMVTQFEDITYINIPYFNPDRFSLEDIMREQGVTDLLMVVDSSEIEPSSRLSRIVENGTDNEEG